jgi:hypothetical protein
MNWDEVKTSLIGPKPLAGENLVHKGMLTKGLVNGLVNQDLMQAAWPCKASEKTKIAVKQSVVLDVPNRNNRYTMQYGHTEADVELQILDWQRQQKKIKMP